MWTAASEAVAQMCSVKKRVLRNFAKFTGKHLCQSLFFSRVAGLRPVISLKKRLWHRCFPVNIAKFIRTPFLKEHLWWLLLLLLVLVRIGLHLWWLLLLLLVLVRIGLVWRAANLSMFCIIVCKSVFEVLRCSFQLILHWWAPNQHTNVDSAMQVTTEVYLDIQTPARGNTRI